MNARETASAAATCFADVAEPDIAAVGEDCRVGDPGSCAMKEDSGTGDAEGSTEDSAAHPEAQPLGKRSRELGRKGEEAAARFLYARGYDIIERNWTCFAGEADIIARDGDILVFVEVKTRRSRDKGFPSEHIDAKKRDKYERIALAYVADCPYVDIAVRFDVVSIVVVGANKAMIRHDIDAFSAS